MAGPQDLFVCPSCRVPLSWDHRLSCGSCGESYLSDDVPCFNDKGAYFDVLPPRREMRKVLEIAKTDGYEQALTGYLSVHFPHVISRTSLALPQRARGLDLLQPSGRERVLDFGCALGVLSLTLARQAKLVVALDATHEAIQFLALLRRQEGLDNLVPVCNGDPLHLPFPDDYYDLVILNAVFEYLPESIDVSSVWEAHRLALNEVRRILRPEGKMYLATKNRFSHHNLLGAQDHNGLRFTALLPRRLANAVSIRKGKGPYRTVTYSFGEYRRLLREAGFRSSQFYWPFPNLWYPERFIPLSGRRAEMLLDLREIKWSSKAKKAFWRAAGFLGVLPELVPTYVIVAQ